MVEHHQTAKAILHLIGKYILCGITVTALLALPFAANAAETMASAGIVRGKVTDSNSNMLPAMIQIVGEDGSVYRDFTNAMGGYSLALEPGAYTLVFSKGFEYDTVVRQVEIERLKTYYLQDVRLTALYDSYAKGWVAGDCHQHTYYSDGVDGVEKVMLANSANGLYFGFLTDHNTSRGVPEYNGATRILVRTEDGQPRYFQGMDGVEVTTEFGHYNSLGSGLTLEPYDLKLTEMERASTDKLAYAREKIKYLADCIIRIGGIAQINHPYSTTTMGTMNWIDATDYEILDLYDTIEIWNGYFCPPDGLFSDRNSMNQNTSSKLLWYGLLNQMKNGHAFHAATGGTDNHDVSGPASAQMREKIVDAPASLQEYYDTWVASAKYSGMPTTYVYFGNEPVTMENAMAAIQAGHSFITSGPIVLCSIDGKTYGESVRASGDDTLFVSADIWNRDGLDSIRIVVNGETVQTIDCGGAQAYTAPIELTRTWDRGDWIVFEVSGPLLQYAITNPIIIDE